MKRSLYGRDLDLRAVFVGYGITFLFATTLVTLFSELFEMVWS